MSTIKTNKIIDTAHETIQYIKNNKPTNDENDVYENEILEYLIKDVICKKKSIMNMRSSRL